MKNSLPSLTQKLEKKESLQPEEAAEAARDLAREEVEAGEKESFLGALSQKSESPEEVAAFAEVFQGLARNPGLEKYAGEAIDVCGTGGDRQGTVNLSSMTALLLASAGVKVFKHGNRSITSKCGSAEFLEAVGFPLDLTNEELGRAMEELGMVFFFAPQFHPAFKSIMPVRQKMAAAGQRTIFNLLGPLINPGRPARQMLGVYAPALLPLFREALERKGLERGLVVHCRLPGRGGLDEIATVGENQVGGVGTLATEEGVRGAGEWDLPEASIEELRGGDLAKNRELFGALLRGEAPGGLRDSLLLNAGHAFWVADRVATVKEGVALARQHLDEGHLAAYVERVRAYFSDRRSA